MPSPSNKPGEFRIAMVSDVHVTDRPDEQMYNRRFAEVIRQVNDSGAQVVLMPGDVTNHGTEPQIMMFKERIKQFQAKVWQVPGNHDVGNKPIPGRAPSPDPHRLELYEKHLGPLFYTAQVLPGLRIVAITSSLLGSGLPQEGPQWDFLARNLSSQAGEIVAVLMHYPLFVRRPEEPNDYFNLDQEPRNRFHELLKQHEIRLVLSGHIHFPLDRRFDGMRHIGAPAVSFGLPAEEPPAPQEQPEGWTLLTLTPDGAATADLRYIPRID